MTDSQQTLHDLQAENRALRSDNYIAHFMISELSNRLGFDGASLVDSPIWPEAVDYAKRLLLEDDLNNS